MINDYQDKIDRYYSVSRTDLISHIPSGLNCVLDVGCADGSFGWMLKKQFGVKEVWGIEPFEKPALNAAEILDRAFHSGVENALVQLGDKKFDCIFFNDVLEHLVDPYTVLASIKSNLAPGGLIFASIPNVLQLENIYKIIRTRNWQYNSFGIMDATHLRFFSRKSMVNMFEQAGYSIQSSIGINPKVTRKFKLLKALVGKKGDDFKYVQFVTIAKVLS